MQLKVTAIALTALVAASQTALASAATLAGWRFKTEGGVATVEGVTPVRAGVSVTVFIDCLDKRPAVQVGYSNDYSGMTSGQRDAAQRVYREIFAENPQIIAYQGGKPLTSTRWSSDSGGTGAMTYAELDRFRRADRVTLAGGKAPIELSVSNLNQAITRLMSSCGR